MKVDKNIPSVLISIQPKWCELTASGKKTIEVRKTRPKLETPFKCYIYRTKGTYSVVSNGKWTRPKTVYGVIGEFVCDKIEHFSVGSLACDDIEKQACLTYREIIDYFYKPNELDGNTLKFGYGWHISDLVIYDEPKKLREFWAYNEELHRRHDVDDDEFCCYDDTNEYGEALTDCGDAYKNILNCYHCWEEWSGWCHRLKHPPQSWCYVEELI